MASNSTPEDAQQRAGSSRQHSRGQSAGNQSNSTTSTPSTNNPPSINAASTSSASSATSTTALPRLSNSSVPVSSTSTNAPNRSTNLSSPLRLPATIPVTSQPNLNSTRSSIDGLSLGRPAPQASNTPSTVAGPSRRDTGGSFTSNSNTLNNTAASHLSNQQSTSPSISLYNFGFQSQGRPAVASTTFTGSGSPSSTNSANRGTSIAPIQQQQHHHQHHLHNQQTQVGSPHRSQATITGAPTLLPTWLAPQLQHGFGNYQNTGTTSGWTLADPAGWSGSARAGRLCSGFEENQVVSFTWVISEANLLRDEVESSPLPSEGGRSISAGAGKSEVWTTQPIFGDGKWKLELVRTTRPIEEDDASKEMKEEGETATGKTVLSVYLTSMILDYSPADLEIPASIMIGIKSAQSQSNTSRVGSWIWRDFTHYVFRRENEFYECHQLPSLSKLLEDKDVQRQDAFSLTVQISTGPRAATPFSPGQAHRERASNGQQASPFVVEDNQLVHHSLIEGLERLLDCHSTGDVVLIVRERGVVRRRQVANDGNEAEDLQDEVWTLPVGTPMYDWSLSQDGTDTNGPKVVVRDRLLWAHSSILGARSEFFNDMLQSHFSEGQEKDLASEPQGDTIQVQGRRVKTLRIKDADFTTIYWLLRYLYLEEVEFVPIEDVRCAALDDEWMMVGQVPADETGQKAVWQWTPLEHLEHSNDDRQEQGIQATTPNDHSHKYHHHVSNQGRSVSRHGQSSNLSPESSLGHHGNMSPNLARPGIPHDLYGTYQRRNDYDWEARKSRSYSQELPTSTSMGQADDSRHQSLLLDPHQHPCIKPPPASALALYRLAHRYHQQGLVHLSKTQLISSLTPQTAFPTLLASNLYEDLYEDVKAYVLDKWDLVSQTKEFERCCDEVSAGEWGVEAGRALRGFMRSLLSPNRSR